MFERYTESARRALFYARYEATELGTRWIDTEHLLLGVMREPKGLIAHLLAHFGVEPGAISAEVASRSRIGEKVPTSVELPFTPSAMRVLQFASSEAEGLRHSYVGTEHLLLGLIREEDGVAAKVLGTRGLGVDAVRRSVVQLLAESAVAPNQSVAGGSAEVHIELAKTLVKQLAETPSGTVEARELAQRILDTLDGLKGYFSE